MASDCLVMVYVFWIIQTGYLYGKMNHIDIRNYGSGNSGTTISGSWEKSGSSSCSQEIFKDGVRLSCGADHLEEAGHPDLYVLYAGLGVIMVCFTCYFKLQRGGREFCHVAGILVSMD